MRPRDDLAAHLARGGGFAPIDLDSAATTRTDPELAAQLAREMVELYANPHSAHAAGRAAARRLAEARASLEGAFPGRRAVFTPSGSAALNLAIRGAWRRRGRAGARLLCSAVEHPAVELCARALAARDGAVYDEAPVHEDGRLDLARFAERLVAGPPCAVVAVMAVQNEVGALLPVREATALAREHAPGAVVVVDAVQALGKVPVPADGWGADAIAVSSHKVQGPKGVGALLASAALVEGDDPLAPLVVGGGQEHGLLAGTEPVAVIAAFVEAVTRALESLPARAPRLEKLRERLLAGLGAEVPGLIVNGPRDPAARSPSIVSVSFPGISARALLDRLDAEHIYASAGAACHSGLAAATRTQRACGFAPERARGTVRFGLHIGLSERDLDYAIARLGEHARALSREGAAAGAVGADAAGASAPAVPGALRGCA